MKSKSFPILALSLSLASCHATSPAPTLILPILYEDQYYLVSHDFASDGTFQLPIRDDEDLQLDNFRSLTAYVDNNQSLELTPLSLERIRDDDYLLTVKAENAKAAIHRIDVEMSDGDLYPLPVHVVLDQNTTECEFWSEGLEVLPSDLYGDRFEVTYHFKSPSDATLDFLRMPSFSFSPLTDLETIEIRSKT